MDMEVRLDFLRQLLKNMNVSSCVITCPGQRIPPEIDLNFRANLFGIRNYSDFLQNSMSEARDILFTASTMNMTATIFFSGFRRRIPIFSSAPIC